MPTRADVERLRLAHAGIRALVERDLREFFASLDLGRPEAARDALVAFSSVLVSEYGEIAAGVAADWYDEVRAAEGVRGGFRARMVVPDERAATVGTVTRAAGALFTPAPEAVLVTLVGRLPKYALTGARETVAASTAADPQSAGWHRETRGAGACRFCRLLAGRGAVYKRATADFAAHNDCNCVAVPSWDANAPEVDVRLYEASRRTTGMTPRQREQHNALIRRAMDEYVPE